MSGRESNVLFSVHCIWGFRLLNNSSFGRWSTYWLIIPLKNWPYIIALHVFILPSAWFFCSWRRNIWYCRFSTVRWSTVIELSLVRYFIPTSFLHTKNRWCFLLKPLSLRVKHGLLLNELVCLWKLHSQLLYFSLHHFFWTIRQKWLMF